MRGSLAPNGIIYSRESYDKFGSENCHDHHRRSCGNAPIDRESWRSIQLRAGRLPVNQCSVPHSGLLFYRTVPAESVAANVSRSPENNGKVTRVRRTRQEITCRHKLQLSEGFANISRLQIRLYCSLEGQPLVKKNIDGNLKLSCYTEQKPDYRRYERIGWRIVGDYMLFDRGEVNSAVSRRNGNNNNKKFMEWPSASWRQRNVTGN